MTAVCVYCASSTQIDEKYFRAAEELGTLIAQRGLRLITGAGNMGLMCAVEDAALAAGGQVTGIIPTFMIKEGWHHAGLMRDIHAGIWQVATTPKEAVELLFSTPNWDKSVRKFAAI